MRMEDATIVHEKQLWLDEPTSLFQQVAESEGVVLEVVQAVAGCHIGYYSGKSEGDWH